MVLQIGTNGKRVPQRCGFEFSIGAAIQHLWDNEKLTKAMAESRLSLGSSQALVATRGPVTSQAAALCA
jgi:hypothetical protein